MKSLLTGAAALLAVLVISVGAQAHTGPTVKWCSIDTDGMHDSFLFGYSFATGDLTCKYSNGKTKTEPVALRVYSIGAQAGNCDMSLNARIAGGDLGLKLSKTSVVQAFAGIEVFNPIRSIIKNKQKTLSASGVIDFTNVGVAVMVAESTYGKGCLVGAKVNLGSLQTGKAYYRAVKRHNNMLERSTDREKWLEENGK